MEFINNLLFFIIFCLSFVMFFYILLKSNFEKLFKKGEIAVIRISYFVASFLLSGIFSYIVKLLVLALYEIITK